MPVTVKASEFGKYRLLHPIGQGSMGTVYKAFASNGLLVAIKVCALDEGWDEASRRAVGKMFETEAAIGRLLRDPNILQVLDTGTVSGVPYLAMQFIEGARTLRPYTRTGALLPVKRAIHIAACCARGLAQAHRVGVVHRDVKPDNIFLTTDCVPKIGDFGIAQLARSDITQVTGVAGSPRYMAPEQALDQDVSPQTDIYSVGVVLFELLTGSPVFKATGISKLLTKIVTMKPPSLTNFRDDLPPGLDELLLRSLEKSPDARQRSADVLADELLTIHSCIR